MIAYTMIDTSDRDGDGVELHKHMCGDAIKKAEIKNPFQPDLVLFDFKAPEGLPVNQLEALAFANWNEDLINDGHVDLWPVRVMPCAGGK